MIKRLEYIPGFGGHTRRSHCRCTEADELVCGVCHPDKRETPAKIELRQRGAQVVAEREARISAWLADLYGTGEERGEPGTERPASWQRPSRALAELAPTSRRERPLSDDEWAKALSWMRKQILRKEERDHREEIAAQAWIELRTPPQELGECTFDEEVSRAWERAKRVLRRERSSVRVRVRSNSFDSTGRKRGD